ncbi:PA26 p53-induced protein-domain-containing protein, partial [Thamnocephalis sphaerospora]
ARQMAGSRMRTALFNSLQTRDAEQRRQAIRAINRVVKVLARVAYPADTPATLTSHRSSVSSINEGLPAVGVDPLPRTSAGLGAESEEARELYKNVLLTVLRLSIDCPFEDVRTSFTELLAKLKANGTPVYTPTRSLPSFFITASQTPPFFDDADDEEDVSKGQRAGSDAGASPGLGQTPLKRSRSSSGANAHIRRLIVDIFMSYGKLSHAFRLLTFFPGYMERFHRGYSAVVRDTVGPLPRPWRYYIGIMAAAQHSSQYLVSSLRLEFLHSGGDPTWLHGLAYAPGKLRRLAVLNTVLAHQPWCLTPAHIAALMPNGNGNGGGSPATENWSMGEMVHAIVLLATFHSLASFSLSCGLVPELDTLGGTEELDMPLLQLPTSVGASNTDHHDDDAGEVLQQDYDEGAEGLGVSLAPSEQNELEAHTVQLLSRLQRYQDGEETDQDAAEDVAEDQDDADAPTPSAFEACDVVESDVRCNPILDDMSRFRHPPVEVRHVDFDVKSDDYSVFRLQDYCWEDHGVELVDKFLRGVGDLLDEEFKETLNITDFSFSNKTALLDTWPLRQAIWYYVLRLAGLSHDDYDYAQVNRYLNRRLKQYVKKVACYPEELDARDFVQFGFVLRAEEKCHVNLLVSVARKQAELVYGLHSVMRWSHKGR